MKNILFIIGFLWLTVTVSAQSISGPTNVIGGQEYTYTFTSETAGLSPSTSCSVLVSSGSLQSTINGTIFLAEGQKSVSFKVKWNNANTTGKIRILPTHGGREGVLSDIKITADNSSENPGNPGNPGSDDITTISGQKITSDKTYINRYINISNSSISNNARVSLVYTKSVSIKPPFTVALGSKLHIYDDSTILLPGDVYNPVHRSTANIEPDLKALPILEQNAPNPFNAVSKISYYVPETAQNAYLQIFDLSGKMLNKIVIKEKGYGFVMLERSDFQPGTIYLYSLIVDGKGVNTKKFYVK